MNVFERIKELANSRGKSIVDVESDLGMSKNYLYKWKKASPNSEWLIKVADYFNVSVDYLLGRTDDKHLSKNKTTADLNDKDAIFTYEGRQIPPEDIELMKRLLRGKKE